MSYATLYSTAARRETVRDWGLVAFGLMAVVLGLASVAIVRAKNDEGTSKFIPQGSESFKLSLSLFLTVVGVILVIAGVVEAL
jgi:hypothetical protein